MDYTNILESLIGLVSSTFINNIKYKFIKDIKNINNNRVIEINIISQIKLKLSG